MLLWSEINDDTIRSLLAIAVVLVAFGLIRAMRARQRYQLVIPDMDQADKGLTAVAGLSSLLRQQARRVFDSPGAPDAASLVKTVGEDIASGLINLHIRLKDIPRLQLEVLAAPRDEIGMLAGGIRAVSPDRGEGFVGALSATLPAQHGSTVQPMTQTRDWSGLHQVGLTLDAGPIDRAHQASATFWSTGIPSGSNDIAQSDRDQLVELLRPAAIWIAIYLAAGSLPIRRANRLSFAKIFVRKHLRDEVDALRAILAAQLATYEMFWYSTKPLIVLGFLDQALDDIDRAIRILDSYFRPHYIAGTIHELCGDAFISLCGLLGRANGIADTTLVDSYARQAAKSFDRARKEFDQALTLLDRTGDAAQRSADRLRLDFHVRSLKAALRGSAPGHALDRVLAAEIAWVTLEQRYNVACLYAVAAAVAADLGRDAQELTERSLGHLVAVISEDSTFVNIIESDSDLLSAFTPEGLHDLTGGARSTSASTLPAYRS